ncbi:DUF2244 domain-containing protein [Phycobacter azelaicus]|uniref:DUF2244 domain-containing protein n=1 Tax=Phycobacter azelaicus TaxID=2668075 RepID=UPI001868F663|nr:DUF2244 domain-containing protein [Phycobacter azelaicus]MBE1297747.1 DUF2244 domain-containing protein [Paracoccaceae bacterium]
MPYNWTSDDITDATSTRELHLWPHQSLPPEGYVRFLAVTAVLITVPLFPLLGSFVLWGVLPFLLLALFGMKWALDRSRRDRQILEVLTIGPDEARLERTDLRGGHQSWECNRYWTTVQIHPNEGPVPNYVTLRGGGREVEIGAFLSEDERKALYDDLQTALHR